MYALLRTRDMAISRYKEFGIPVDWLLDSGIVGKVSFEALTIQTSSLLNAAFVLYNLHLSFF